MLKSVATTTLLALMAWACSGCALVGPVLTAGSFTLGGPVQYASTVWSIGEYAYEYAANDKAPDEVIQGKFDALADALDGDDEEVMLAESGKGLSLRQRRALNARYQQQLELAFYAEQDEAPSLAANAAERRLRLESGPGGSHEYRFAALAQQ